MTEQGVGRHIISRFTCLLLYLHTAAVWTTMPAGLSAVWFVTNEPPWNAGLGRRVRHMQASPSPERTGSAAVRNGLLFGAIIAVVYVMSAVIQDLTGTTVALITVGSAFRPLSLLNQVSLLV